MNSQIILLLAAIYAALLFYIAWRAESWRNLSRHWQAVVYSLSLAVYCSSWTFFGAVGTAVDQGWSFTTIFLGPILMFAFGWPFIRRLLVMAARNKVTSIADFIGSRYGKSQQLAAFVTIVAVLGSLPYISLQLKAVSLAWSMVSHEQSDFFAAAMSGSGTSFITALIMAWFAIIFGVRELDGPRRHKGMVMAVAIESAVKFIAFVAVAYLAVTWLGQPGFSLQLPKALQEGPVINASYITQLFLAMVAVICLPRQFHVMAVEHHSSRDSRLARWLFPLYLFLFGLMVLPVAMVGQQLFANSAAPGDSYVLLLALQQQNSVLMALVFIGGLSAATGMVVVAAVTLSVMVSNELIVPLWLRLSASAEKDISKIGFRLQLMRRLSIIGLMLLAWLLESYLTSFQGLASIGLIAFAAAAQTLPALVGALYWRRGHKDGVLIGLLVGIGLWAYCLLLPSLLGAEHELVMNGPWGIGFLSPIDLFGTGYFGSLTHGVLWSLSLNVLCFVLVSRRSHFNPLDVRQATAFTQLRNPSRFRSHDFTPTEIEVCQLQGLLQPLLGDIRDLELWRDFEQRLGHRLLPHDPAPRFVVHIVEESLASIIGAVSAHRAIDLLRKQQPLPLEEFVSLVGGSSRQLEFNQQLLQTTLETIPQGISVIDAELKLVAWNKGYEQIFDYPERLLYIGCPISKVYEYNAERGLFGQTAVDSAVAKRLALLCEGRPHRFERRMPNDVMIEIRGTPTANGGYVTTYTDVTEYHTVLDQLADSKDQLETRVKERTGELVTANDSLKRENRLRARVEQELSKVHETKSRFLAAASHDLLQPVNAARLFVASLQDKAEHQQLDSAAADIAHIDGALTSVENLISSMREIARLDSGKLTPRRKNFPIMQILEPLAGEFSLLAKDNDLTFKFVESRHWVNTDPQLLRRIVQNFLSNALRYTRRGKILLGCRVKNGELKIEVWDTGVGIAEKDRQIIFQEFERLGSGHDSQQGLGLGLSIANRMAQLLGHPLELESTTGLGSVFSISVPVAKAREQQVVPKVRETELDGLHLLCVDNEPAILAGMQSLLEQWGCHVTCAPSLQEALKRWNLERAPDVILADYHLDDDTGIDLLQALSMHWQQKLKAVVISADNNDHLRRTVKDAGYLFLAKPVKPASLRSSLRRLSR